VIRFFVWLKPHVLRVLDYAAKPLRSLGRVFLSVLVPLYHLLYIVRKQLARLYRPAKNKVMVLVANRYVAHGTIAVFVLATVLSNIQTDEVRAETFGQKSLLFSLVAVQDELIEEYAVEGLAGVQIGNVSYRDGGALSFARGVDFIGSLDDPTSTALSDTSLVGADDATDPTAVVVSGTSTNRISVESYTVQGGDTLSTIAGKFDLALNTILWANSLSVSTVLQPGDDLTILPVDGVYHAVSSGDTVASIAQTYDVDQETIADYNGLANANALSVGDELLIPGGEVQAVSRSTSSAITSIISTPTPSSGTTTTISSPTVTGSGSMIWPTDLYTITQYYGWGHTGLDVDCGFTNDNYAADAGYVQYSGWKGGYGYTVEINHGNGIVTRYGHHSSMYVSAGEYVAQGQAIGRCGTTGRSTGTHLHFEVIANGSYRNPLEYIR
jgi:LysM repeat protein